MLIFLREHDAPCDPGVLHKIFRRAHHHLTHTDKVKDEEYTLLYVLVRHHTLALVILLIPPPQFLGVFYLTLALVVVGTNIGCRTRSQQTRNMGEVVVVQTMEGRSVTSKLVGEDAMQICCQNNV